ncbi:MAG: hypothetical protein HC836_44580 [Richelia sp. RM2_1_2]|nr:hypothetical protein [Richelia sp. RM2_1_2]
MATKIVENITANDIELKDLGITILAGNTYDLSSKPKSVIANSNNLAQQLGTGNLVVQKDPGATPIEYYTTVEAIRALMDFHETMPKSTDSVKIAVHASAKPTNTSTGIPFNTHWTGAGDDVTNHVLGDGPMAFITNEVGVATKSVDVEFDPLFGKVFILHGYIGFDSAGGGDYISATAVARATVLQQFVDLDFVIDNHKVKIASGGPGTGTHGFGGTPTLVPNLTLTGHWNYSDIHGLTPSLDQTGAYDIYDIEVEVDRLMNKIPVFGDNHVTMSLEASDHSELAPGYYIKVTTHNVSNTAWRAWFFVEMYRERSVNQNF